MKGKDSAVACGSTARTERLPTAFMEAMSRPFMDTLPEYGSSPDSALRNVVLPEPFGPTIAASSPGLISKSTLEMIFLPPIDTDTLRASIMGLPHRSRIPRLRSSIQRKNGAPAAAVTMPIGNSAGATMVRLTASASSSRLAPSSAEAGSR